MTNAEFGSVQAWSRVGFIEGMIVVAFLEEGEIRGFGEVRFIVEEVEDADGFLREKMDDGQIVLRGRGND